MEDSNVIVSNQEEFIANNVNETTSASVPYSNVIVSNQEEFITNNINETTSASVPCSKCLKYDTLLDENKQLKVVIDDFNKSQEERLNRQASMFHELINKKEAEFKQKLKIIREKKKL